MSLTRISTRQSIWLLSLSLFLGVLADWLFHGTASGVSVLIFMVCVYGVFFFLLRKLIEFRHWFPWFLSAAALLLALTYTLFLNPVFAVMNVFLIPAIFAASAILFTNNNSIEWYDIRFLRELFPRFFGKTLAHIPKVFHALQVFKVKRENERWAVLRQILWGIFISIPLLALVVYLLASADQVFNSLVDGIPDLFETLDTTKIILHGANILIIMSLLGGFFWSLLHKELDAKKEDLFEVDRNQNPITASTVLILVNIVYALFIAIQFSYLFGGSDLSFLGDFTYAEYARRGFAEIVLVTIINLTLSLFVLQSVKNKQDRLKLFVQILVSLLIVLSACLLYSASFRLSLYEEAFGYTYRRFFARTIMVMMAAFFASTFVKVWAQKISVTKAYVVIALILFVGLNYLNIDHRIAAQNLQRFEDSGHLDFWYLHKISDDALLQASYLLESEDEGVRRQINEYLLLTKYKLDREIYTGWQAYNVARVKAQKTLKSLDLSE